MTQGPTGPSGPGSFTMTPFGPGHPQRGPTGPQGAQGMQNIPAVPADGRDGPRSAEEIRRRTEFLRREGMPPGRIESVSGTPLHTHPPFVPPEVVERRIVEFFKSSKRVRSGVDVDCPFCGAAMVVRVRGRDGRTFLGCMRYPSCSGSHDIPDAVQEESKEWERQLMTSDHSAASMMQQQRARNLADVDKHFPDLLKTPKKEANMETKTATETQDTAVPSIAARLKRSAARAPYRMARMRALTEGRKALLAALRPRVQPAAFDIVEAFLDTDAGQGAIIGAIGLAGPMTPKFGKNKHVQALCEEFLDEGVAKGFNQVLGLLASIVEPALASAASSIPELADVADKVVPKRRKKRVAAVPAPEARVDRGPVPEDEESQPRSLRAVAGR